MNIQTTLKTYRAIKNFIDQNKIRDFSSFDLNTKHETFRKNLFKTKFALKINHKDKSIYRIRISQNAKAKIEYYPPGQDKAKYILFLPPYPDFSYSMLIQTLLRLKFPAKKVMLSISPFRAFIYSLCIILAYLSKRLSKRYIREHKELQQKALFDEVIPIKLYLSPDSKGIMMYYIALSTAFEGFKKYTYNLEDLLRMLPMALERAYHLCYRYDSLINYKKPFEMSFTEVSIKATKIIAYAILDSEILYNV